LQKIKNKDLLDVSEKIAEGQANQKLILLQMMGLEKDVKQ